MCHHQRRWQLRALASFKYMLRARHREALVRSLNHLTKWCSPVCHIVTRMVRSWNYTCAMHTQPSNRLYSTCKEKWKRKTQTMPRDRRCTLAAGDAPTVPCLYTCLITTVPIEWQCVMIMWDDGGRAHNHHTKVCAENSPSRSPSAIIKPCAMHTQLANIA